MDTSSLQYTRSLLDTAAAMELALACRDLLPADDQTVWRKKLGPVLIIPVVSADLSRYSVCIPVHVCIHTYTGIEQGSVYVYTRIYTAVLSDRRNGQTNEKWRNFQPARVKWK